MRKGSEDVEMLPRPPLEGTGGAREGEDSDEGDIFAEFDGRATADQQLPSSPPPPEEGQQTPFQATMTPSSSSSALAAMKAFRSKAMRSSSRLLTMETLGLSGFEFPKFTFRTRASQVP